MNVKGIIDELDLEEFDSLVPSSDLSNLSIGNRIRGMNLSSLGFLNNSRYLLEHFYTEKKPVNRLFIDIIEGKQLYDDPFGRCLDKISEVDSAHFILR